MSYNLSDHDTTVVLLALRHLQSSIEKGENLSGYSDIHPAPDLISPLDIDSLCESLNIETTMEDSL